MKKTLVLVIMAGMLSAGAVNVEGSSCVNEIWVETPVTSTTINAAIASAQPGDCVIIPNGTYSSLNQIIVPGDVDGAEANPIILKAATPGGVTFTGNCASPLILIQGDWWVIRDFQFIDISEVGAANTKGIYTRDANNVRITNNYFQRFGDLVDAGKQNWPIWIANNGSADGIRVDHNTFIDNEAMNVHVSENGINTRIDHNYFKNSSTSNADCMMIGGGGSAEASAKDLYTIIEYNLFENMYGDEVVTTKSSSNTIRYNVLKNSSRGMVLRSGDDCVVEGISLMFLPRMLECMVLGIG